MTGRELDTDFYRLRVPSTQTKKEFFARMQSRCRDHPDKIIDLGFENNGRPYQSGLYHVQRTTVITNNHTTDYQETGNRDSVTSVTIHGVIADRREAKSLLEEITGMYLVQIDPCNGNEDLK
jgi:hypothetical protein